MFTLKRMHSICLLVLVCGLLAGTQLNAQSLQSSGFPGERILVSFSPGWGLYSLEDINKHYIDRFAKEAGILDDNIDGGPGLYGEISYFVTPSISTGFGVAYLYGRSERKSWENVLVDGEGTFAMRWERSLATSALAPQLVVKCHFPLRDLDLFTGAGVALCWGKTVVRSDTRIPDLGVSFVTEDRFTAQGTGFLGSIGMSHDLTDRFGIGTEIGYRHFPMGDLETEAGNPWVVEYGGTHHAMELDFSGAFLLVTLSLRL